jgi:hypothetical protein
MTLGVILDEFHGYDPSVGPQHTVYIAAFQSSKRVATGGETVRIDRGARLLAVSSIATALAPFPGWCTWGLRVVASRV